MLKTDFCLQCGEIPIFCMLCVVCLFRFRFRGTDWAGQSRAYKTKRVCWISFTVVANLALTAGGVGRESYPDSPGGFIF